MDPTDSLCNPAMAIHASQLLGTVCVHGGAECPLLDKEAAAVILGRVKHDPTVAIQLTSNADTLSHYASLGPNDYARRNPADVFNRKRDLDVLQRLGLVPGDVRRARFLYELLFARIATPTGICAYDTPNWKGCPQARTGAYERVRAQGWTSIVYHRSAQEMAECRKRNVQDIETAERLSMRPHHLMCLACGYAGGENDSPRPNDTLYEILVRIRRQPDVPITLVEGPCMACDSCDGFHPPTGRCVHTCGLIRDFKKDLDCFQRLGLIPGATLPAKELFSLVFERIQTTRDICAYGDGVVTAEEWQICGSPEGNPGYTRTRQTGIF